jgi:hypothetical protein
MGCLISVFDLKSKNHNEENVKIEPMIHNNKVDNEIYYSDYSDYSPPRYNKLYGWD